jgi:hypothetical protein
VRQRKIAELEVRKQAAEAKRSQKQREREEEHTRAPEELAKVAHPSPKKLNRLKKPE